MDSFQFSLGPKAKFLGVIYEKRLEGKHSWSEKTDLSSIHAPQVSARDGSEVLGARR